MEAKGKCRAEIRRRKPASRNSETQEWGLWNSPLRVRACFKISRRPAARDFGRGQGGKFRASPQRAVRNEPTPATGKRPAARRVFGQKAFWLRCSVGAARRARWRVSSLVAPCYLAFCPKTGPLLILKQALKGLTEDDRIGCERAPLGGR
jgi:hypothetical protein